MSTATPPSDDLALDNLDIISPQKYEREGYPHREWTWLRQNDPVHWTDSEFCKPFWAVTKHADIVAIGKNPTDWIIAPRTAVFTREIPPEPTTRQLLTMDPPDHGRYRNVIAKWFTPRTVKVWEPKVQRVTREVLDAAAEKGEIDFVADVSAPITIAVIALMLGLPEEDWPLLFRWTNEIIAPEDPEFQRGRTSSETSDSARDELFAYFKEIAGKRRHDAKEDILTAVVQGKVDGAPLPDFELLSYYFLLVVAGNETTRNAMTGGIQCFLDNPDQWKGLVEDPSLVEGAIEETVRWTRPGASRQEDPRGRVRVPLLRLGQPGRRHLRGPLQLPDRPQAQRSHRLRPWRARVPRSPPGPSGDPHHVPAAARAARQHGAQGSGRAGALELRRRDQARAHALGVARRELSHSAQTTRYTPSPAASPRAPDRAREPSRVPRPRHPRDSREGAG
jgi:cholest-4-en-3-one 26-monooxygenase